MTTIGFDIVEVFLETWKHKFSYRRLNKNLLQVHWNDGGYNYIQVK